MERSYDLFESFADGTPMWRGQAKGLEIARATLQKLASETKNECFAMYLPTREVVYRVNAPTGSSGKPLVLQIAYDQRLAPARADILKSRGYEVVTVFGNQAAIAVLSMPRKWDFFIVGHAAPQHSRIEMVEWLKANYPQVRILALNPRTIRALAGADFNVELNGPDRWLAVVTSTVPCQM